MLMKMSSQMKRTNNQKGFTLVELMVVVVIIGILVAVAVPVYNSVTHKANKKSVEANLRTIDGAIMQYLATEDTTPASTDALTAGITGSYLQTWPTGPSGVASYTIGGAGTPASPWVAQVTFSAANPYGVTIAVGPHTLSELKGTTGW